MKRVLIVGSPGAGKSTLAKKLAARTSLPLIHLDDLYWHPGWVRVERALWLRRLQNALEGDTWILDGNFSSSLLRRAYRADHVLFLMPPRLLCLWRAARRELFGLYPHGQHRAHWPSRELLRDVWTFPAQAEWQRAQLRTVPGLKVTVLRQAGELEKFLRRVTDEQRGGFQA